MTDDIATSIETIDGGLQRLERSALQQALQPGVPAAAVQGALGQVGLEALPELVSLYAWRDGTSTAGAVTVDDIQLFPGFYLLSLEDAVANYQASVDDTRWRTGWLPVFANGGAISMSLTSARQGRVRCAISESTSRSIRSSSIH